MDKHAKVERRLSCMFEYQRFSCNERLAAMHEDIQLQDDEKE